MVGFFFPISAHSLIFMLDVVSATRLEATFKAYPGWSPGRLGHQGKDFQKQAVQTEQFFNSMNFRPVPNAAQRDGCCPRLTNAQLYRNIFSGGAHGWVSLDVQKQQ